MKRIARFEARNEPNRISESNFSSGGRPSGKAWRICSASSQHPSAVLAHLFRPRQLGIVEDGFEDEQRPVQAQGFPSLRECSARFAGFDDDGGVAEQGHGAVAPRKVRAQRRMTEGELRHDQVPFLRRRWSGAFDGGWASSSGVPRTAIVRPPRCSVSSCAAVSIPAARPLTITTSCSTSVPTSLATRFRPGSEAFREPTTATRTADCRSETSPHAYRCSGAWRFSNSLMPPMICTGSSVTIAEGRATRAFPAAISVQFTSRLRSALGCCRLSVPAPRSSTITVDLHHSEA